MEMVRLSMKDIQLWSPEKLMKISTGLLKAFGFNSTKTAGTILRFPQKYLMVWFADVPNEIQKLTVEL